MKARKESLTQIDIDVSDKFKAFDVRTRYAKEINEMMRSARAPV